MGRWDYTTESLGVLELKNNSKTGKAKGVTKSGQKKIVRAWCHRRQRTMYVGTFPDTPQAQAALASAEDYGVGNIPTPKARKARTKKTGTHVAIPHSPCLALRLRARGFMRVLTCGRPKFAKGDAARPRLERLRRSYRPALAVLDGWRRARRACE